MMMGDQRYIVCTFWIGGLLTCVFSDCIGLFGGNKKGGVCMFAQRDFFIRLDGKFISSIFSQQDIYIHTYLNINLPVE